MPDRSDSVALTRLDNGLRIVTESIPGVQSATLGVWVQNGSRYEERQQAGISHFLEHLYFKGTERRTAAQIAEEIDAVGGLLNAFTGKEYTCYYAKVLGEHLPIAQDVLADVLLNSCFDPEEIDRERAVVVQEILQSEDTPDDYVHDLFGLQFWPDHPLSFPICGRVETVEGFTRDDIVDFIAARYRPDRIILVAAGKLQHAQMVDWAMNCFGGLHGKATVISAAAPVSQRSVRVVEKPLEQVHLCLGTPGVSQTDDERYAAYLLNTALGGGMSSRLFQEVREKRGRAYSVYSFLSAYSDGGYLGVYAGTSAAWAKEVLSVTVAELNKLKHEGLRQEDLQRTKNQLKGNLLLGLEATDNRMSRLAKNQIYAGTNITPEEVAARIDASTNDQIVALAERIVQPESMAITVLGDLDGATVGEELLGG
jgi:predicted Zn-dependent peptidase